MSPRVQLLSIVTSALLVVLVFSLVRRKKLSEGYSVLWLALCAGVALAAIWNDAFFDASRALGIANAVSFLVFLVGAFAGLYFLHLSAEVTSLREQNRELVQWIGLLRHRVDALEAARPCPGLAAGDSSQRRSEGPEGDRGTAAPEKETA